MPQIVDRIDFACTDVDPSQWPKLSCSGANQLRLEAGSLQIEADRELLFADNGQIRAFDDSHKLVFNRSGKLLELHEAGDIRFLTGAPAPTEKLRIRADGNVGIGTTSPTQALEVTGAVKATEFIRGTTALVSSQWKDVAGGITYTSGRVSTDALMVNGAAELKKTLTVKGATILEGNVGIGSLAPQHKLQIGNEKISIGFDPWDISPNAGYIRFGDNTGWKLHFGRSYEGVGKNLNAGTTGVLMTIQDKGNVGIGTLNPEAKLHIAEGGSIIHGVLIGANVRGLIKNPWPYETISVAQPNFNLRLESPGTIVFHPGGSRDNVLVIDQQWHIIHAKGARCDGLRWLDQSSASYKTDVKHLSLEKALETLADLNPIIFRYQEEDKGMHHVGFIAEDVPELVASQDRKGLSAMDIVGVLTKVVQYQQQEITELRAKLL